jgi:hypothetical protein
MPWRTSENKIDCGIFAMRHMETYTGEATWDCAIVNESKDNDNQKTQLEELRQKYLTKILLSDINDLRVEIIVNAKRFNQDRKTKITSLKATLVQNLIDRQNII